MKHKIGERVGAVSHSEEDTFYIYGFGVYEGRFEPPEDIGFTGLPNPRIKLDKGKTVWGCECWWGSEAAIQKQLEGKTVVMVDIDEAREKAKAYIS